LLKQQSEENRVLRTLCFVLQAAQNPSHAFPNAAYGGYKQLNELSCLNGNSMNDTILSGAGAFQG
jgi:hypothetical protein